METSASAAIDARIQELGDWVDEEALTALIHAAVALNSRKRK